jgi:hypothetical protein
VIFIFQSDIEHDHLGGTLLRTTDELEIGLTPANTTGLSRQVIFTDLNDSIMVQPIHQVLILKMKQIGDVPTQGFAETRIINEKNGPIMDIFSTDIEKINNQCALQKIIQAEEASIDDELNTDDEDQNFLEQEALHSTVPYEQDPSDNTVEEEEDQVLDDTNEVNNIDLQFTTPQTIIESLHSLEGTPKTNPNFDLTHSIKTLSVISNVGPLFVPYETGIHRRTQVFKCSCSQSHQCPAFISYCYENDHLSIVHEDHDHNHSIADIMRKRKYTSAIIPEETLQKIQQFTEIGLSPGAIRIKLGLTLSTKRFYDIRRPFLKRLQGKQAIDLKNEIDKWNGWATQITSNHGIFHSFYAVNLQHANEEYAVFCNIMDDTAKTNYFNLPLFVIITPDNRNKSRVLAFAILSNKTTSEIKSFLQFLLRFTKKAPNFIIIDRYQSQITAIEEVFNSQCIIYCRLHISSNMLDVMKNAEVVDLFWKLSKNACTEDIFLSKLLQIKDTTNSVKISRFINSLMSELDRWLPNRVDQRCKISVTSRVEGFFGQLKTHTNHQQLTLRDLCVLIKVLSEIESDDVIPDESSTSGEKFTTIVEMKEDKEDESLSFNYHDLQATFEPYFSAAHRVAKVQTILSDTYASLHKMDQSPEQSQITIRDPSTIKQSGASDVYPAKNSHLSGATKKKMTYHCSICNSKFHNKNKCPKK